MEQNELEYLQELEQSYNVEKQKNMDLMQNQSSMFGSSQQGNLIEYQLELDNILERVDHLLRGHELKFDDNGNLKWIEQKDKRKRTFNDYGVQEVLRVLSMYLNRNTILSNYDEETINWKVYELGIDLSDLVFMKYEQMGLDNPDKIKLYPIMIRELTDTVHSTYLRALHGGERQSLREARHVTQSQPMFNQDMYPGMNKNSFSLFKPSTWTKH